MVKKLLFTLSCLSISYMHPYSRQDLQTLETTAAVVKCSESIVSALAPESTPPLKFIGALSKEIQLLTSYALYDNNNELTPFLMPSFTKILDRVAAKESWQYAPQPDVEFMKLFAKEFSIEFSHGVSIEIIRYLQKVALQILLPNHRKLRRFLDCIATSITETALDTSFDFFNEVDNSTQEPFIKEFLTAALAKFYREAGYHVAGELIISNASV